MAAQAKQAGQPGAKRPDVATEAPASESGATGRSGAWRLTLPYPPSTNNLYMTVRGRRVKTPEAREYTNVVGTLAKLARDLQGELGPPPYRLTILLYAPDSRRRDADNGVKCLQDALLKCTGHDDAEVVELIVRKCGKDTVMPRAEVTLEPAA